MKAARAVARAEDQLATVIESKSELETEVRHLEDQLAAMIDRACALEQEAEAKVQLLEEEIVVGKERKAALEQDLAEACQHAEAYHTEAAECQRRQHLEMHGAAEQATQVLLGSLMNATGDDFEVQDEVWCMKLSLLGKDLRKDLRSSLISGTRHQLACP
jgi:predicted RNase H-like nuclease (RuvC/YqgF family)